MASLFDLSGSDSEDDLDYVPSKIIDVPSDSSSDGEISDEHDGLGSGAFLNSKETGTTKSEQLKANDEEREKKLRSFVTDEERKHANDLWESFLNDVESFIPKKSNSPGCNDNATATSSDSGTKAPEIETKPSTEVFDFTEDSVDDLNSSDSAQEKNECTPAPKASYMPKKRGIDSVLGKILNKNKKQTVLEKSALDWKNFKKDEGLDNELEKFNKGKQGFIERQRFLERSDQRSFEKEKSMRQSLRKK